MLVNLSEAQDETMGDGTTSVIVVAGALCASAVPLIEKGLHPHQIIKGYKLAAEYAVSVLHSKISLKLDFNIPSDSSSEERNVKLIDNLVRMATTPLNSKLVSR